MGQPSFTDLQFGLAEAAREAERYPALLDQGFYDPAGLAASVLDGYTWLILGAKGSGKSALVEHLKLLHSDSDDVFVTSYDLYEFPFRDFIELDFATDVAARLPNNWRWVLILAIVASFEGDIHSASRHGGEFQKTIDVLRRAGYYPQLKLSEIVQETNSVSIGAVLKGLTGSFQNSRQKRGLSINAAVQTVSRTVFDFRGKARHFIVLDGFDKQFANGSVPWGAITSLVVTVDNLNANLQREGSPAKVVLLMRPDMYDRLLSADTPKFRRDSGRSINWYPTSEDASASELFDLVNRKAGAQFGHDIDVVRSFLPAQVRPRGGPNPINIYRYLIDRTRHTPRDLGQLLESIQLTTRNAGRNDPSQSNIIDGANEYAFNYFYSDVRSAMIGLVPEFDIDGLFSILKAAPGDKFSRRWILDASRERGIAFEDLDETLRQLHQAGAISNFDTNERLNFIYIQPTAEIDVHGLMTLQRTFARGLNRAPLWVAPRAPRS